jgi:hypothetical protein
MPQEDQDLDRLRENNRESVEKLRSLLDEMRTVEEHEKNILDISERVPPESDVGSTSEPGQAQESIGPSGPVTQWA